MKTGFSHGFNNKQVKKSFGYHGLKLDCNKPPDPPNYYEDPTTSGPYWRLVQEWWPNTGGTFSTAYSVYWFLPSLLNDLCFKKYFDGKLRYYYIYLYYRTWLAGGYCSAMWSENSICNLKTQAGYYPLGMTVAGAKAIWFGATTLVWLLGPRPPTHLMIYVSDSGELPPLPP